MNTDHSLQDEHQLQQRQDDAASGFATGTSLAAYWVQPRVESIRNLTNLGSCCTQIARRSALPGLFQLVGAEPGCIAGDYRGSRSAPHEPCARNTGFAVLWQQLNMCSVTGVLVALRPCRSGCQCFKRHWRMSVPSFCSSKFLMITTLSMVC